MTVEIIGVKAQPESDRCAVTAAAQCLRSQCFSYIASKTKLKLPTYMRIKESGNFSMSASADDGAAHLKAAEVENRE